MLEEVAEYIQDQDKSKSAFINHQIVKLLQQKTLPLNRQRYLHLQKINRTNVKLSTQTLASSPRLPPTLNLSSSQHSSPLPVLEKSKSSRYFHEATADLLINRLKNLKDLKHTSQLLTKDHLAGRCWEKLRTSIIASGQSGRNTETKPSQKTVKISEGGRRHKQHYLELTRRAERYLRVKKHQLKQKHLQQQEYSKIRKQKSSNPTQLQILLSNFHTLPQSKQMTDEQLEFQILQDIREIMLQQNLNRLKMDINHRKIVQLR